jgi:hypothetical protein
LNLFPALGLAVLGIFATVVLGGLLAGVIAFGVIDGGLRSWVQRRVIGRLVEGPLRKMRGDYFPIQEGMLPHSWDRETIDALMQVAENRDGLAHFLRIDAQRLYELPYRQLCGQIASGISAELHDDADDRTARSTFQPVTAMLVIAESVNNGDHRRAMVDLEPQHARHRALQFIDTIQITLASAVFTTARWCAALFVALMLAAILFPSLNAFNMYSDYRSTVLRAFGSMLAVAIAVIIVIALSYASTIVALITFRWVDRHASLR